MADQRHDGVLQSNQLLAHRRHSRQSPAATRQIHFRSSGRVDSLVATQSGHYAVRSYRQEASIVAAQGGWASIVPGYSEIAEGELRCVSI